MRLYGKRLVGNYVDRINAAREETRDAILWDVISAQRLCRVKIQGSNTLVVAHYPDNWEATPNWLKPGNSVKIMHTMGLRGRIEVVGHGQTVPTPVAGDPTPDPITPPDCILTGCLVSAVPNNNKMVVHVRIGTYRIAGVTYTLDQISMLYGDYFVLGDGGGMETMAGAVAISAAPAAGYFRYDMVSVGTDGVLHYTAGTPATTFPVKPTPAANHVRCGAYVLVPSGITKIEQKHIGMAWSAPIPIALVMTIGDKDLAYGENDTTVKLEVFDQYGNALLTSGYGWYLTLEIVAGNGYVSSAEEGESATKTGQHTGAANSSYTFGYRRDGGPGDLSPVLKGTLEIDYPITISDALQVHTS